METSPNIVYTWGLFNQNVSLDQIAQPSHTLCWASKLAGEKEITYRRRGQPDFLTLLKEQLEDSDCVMTYNGRRFDLPIVNTEFALAGLSPRAPYKHIDLLETVKKQFRFTSGKMQFVCEALGVGSKVEHEGFPLWVKCLEGDVDAWAKMKEYNIGDIVVLESLYNRLRPWILNHPNEALYTPAGEMQCTTCGSTHLQKRGFHVTGVGRYQRYQCVDCGSWSRSRITDVSKDARGVLLAPL